MIWSAVLVHAGAVQTQHESTETVYSAMMRWVHIVWMFLVCIFSGALIACLIVVVLKRQSIDQTQDIVFLLIGIVLLMLCLWSGIQFMRGCHSLGQNCTGRKNVLSGNQNMIQVDECV